MLLLSFNSVLFSIYHSPQLIDFWVCYNWLVWGVWGCSELLYVFYIFLVLILLAVIRFVLLLSWLYCLISSWTSVFDYFSIPSNLWIIINLSSLNWYQYFSRRFVVIFDLILLQIQNFDSSSLFLYLDLLPICGSLWCKSLLWFFKVIYVCNFLKPVSVSFYFCQWWFSLEMAQS